MIKFAIYGKGGIGKSTLSSNLSAALAARGLIVMQIGCDPKADSTTLLRPKEEMSTVLDLVRSGKPFTLEDMVKESSAGVYCVEAGGPIPGLGCAGRGIITTFSLLEELELYKTYKPDAVLYDVLGDVVCGGFAAPIREGYADNVLIVTSGEKMALYAANNINTAVKNFEDRSYAKVRGIVMNRRAVEGEEEKVRAFAEQAGLDIIADIPRTNDIIHYEDLGKTVIEGNPELEVSKRFLELAQLLIDEDEN